MAERRLDREKMEVLPMHGRTFASLVSSLLLSFACGGAEESAAPVAAASPGVPISGMYEVSGVTTETASGHQRKISGTIILAEEGPRYIATFNLSTSFPGGDQPLPAEVIGKGEGTIEGRTLKGTSHTQLVVGTVPGVDPGFAFIPRMVSTRIVSTSVTEIAPDGAVEIELSNAPEGDEDYSPTRTVLTGKRVSAAGLAAASAD
jgi:hypothetical protein